MGKSFKRMKPRKEDTDRARREAEKRRTLALRAARMTKRRAV